MARWRARLPTQSSKYPTAFLVARLLLRKAALMQRLLIPRRSLADAFNPKQNSFGLLRLGLALSVLFYHCYPLGGFGLAPLQRLSGGRDAIGSTAVAAFFVLSGF